jgi:hypothetical protein
MSFWKNSDPLQSEMSTALFELHLCTHITSSIMTSPKYIFIAADETNSFAILDMATMPALSE